MPPTKCLIIQKPPSHIVSLSTFVSHCTVCRSVIVCLSLSVSQCLSLNVCLVVSVFTHLTAVTTLTVVTIPTAVTILTTFWFRLFELSWPPFPCMWVIILSIPHDQRQRCDESLPFVRAAADFPSCINWIHHICWAPTSSDWTLSLLNLILTARMSSIHIGNVFICIYRSSLLDEIIFNATIDDHGSNQENKEGKESPATLPVIVTALHGETQILADSPRRIVLIVFLLEQNPGYQRRARVHKHRKVSNMKALLTSHTWFPMSHYTLIQKHDFLNVRVQFQGMFHIAARCKRLRGREN